MSKTRGVLVKNPSADFTKGETCVAQRAAPHLLRASAGRTLIINNQTSGLPRPPGGASGHVRSKPRPFGPPLQTRKRFGPLLDHPGPSSVRCNCNASFTCGNVAANTGASPSTLLSGDGPHGADLRVAYSTDLGVLGRTFIVGANLEGTIFEE